MTRLVAAAVVSVFVVASSCGGPLDEEPGAAGTASQTAPLTSQPPQAPDLPQTATPSAGKTDGGATFLIYGIHDILISG